MSHGPFGLDETAAAVAGWVIDDPVVVPANTSIKTHAIFLATFTPLISSATPLFHPCL
jgi:hypothetical protein